MSRTGTTALTFVRSAWWALAALLAWEVRSQTPELPEGQLCPSVCTDLVLGCPVVDEPEGDAPERYVGDPYNVQWPDRTAHPLCQFGDSTINNCCACGGGFVPDSCPNGGELQLTLPSRNELQSELPESLAAGPAGEVAGAGVGPAAGAADGNERGGGLPGQARRHGRCRDPRCARPAARSR